MPRADIVAMDSLGVAFAVSFVLLPCAGLAQEPATLVADLNLESNVEEMADLYGVAVFWHAISGGNGLEELWRSDGTAAGTYPLATRSPAFVSFKTYRDLVPAGGNVYFASTDVATGAELWKTDGTVVGTRIVRDLLPNQTDSSPDDLVGVGRLLFFTARTLGLGERELFVSDGTFAGTKMVKDIVPGPSGSWPARLTPWRGKLYFVARNQLWVSDGTGAGTRAVGALPAPVDDLDALSGGIYLRLRPSFSGSRQLWVFDGAALVQLGSWSVARANDEISDPVDRDGEVFFSVQPQGSVTQVWSTDGTPGGTRREFDITESFASFAPLGGAILFGKTSPGIGRELWRYDRATGTESLVLDLLPGASSSNPRFGSLPGPLGGGVLFSTQNGFTEVWFSDGTAANTVRIAPSYYNFPFRVGSRQVWFEGSGKLWSTDGTVAGTVEEYSGGSASPFLASGKNLLFLRYDPGPPAGRDLWRINPGGQARAVGDADAAGLAQPTTAATDPVLGSTSTWQVDAMPNGALYAMVLGLPTARPSFLPLSNYLDPLASLLVIAGIGSGTTPSLDVAVPNDPSLRNAQLMLQTWWYQNGLRGTNGVLLVPGS